MGSLQTLCSTMNSITLCWNIGAERVKYFQLQRKNDINKWITTYLGFKTQVTVNDLQPSESYHFCLSVKMEDEKSWNIFVAAATKDQPLAISYLHRATEIGNFTKVKNFLKSRPGSAVLEACDGSGRSALMLATIHGHMHILSLLLDSGANVNLQNPLGRTALMTACSLGFRDIVQLLLDRGAMWEIKDRNGCSAINYAVDASQLECLQTALEGGANIETRDNQQMTVLMRAVLVESSLEVIRELVSRGSHVNACDGRNVTSLMLATLSSRAPIIDILLQAGAHSDQATIYDNTALDMAQAKGNKEIIAALKEPDEAVTKTLWHLKATSTSMPA